MRKCPQFFMSLPNVINSGVNVVKMRQWDYPFQTVRKPYIQLLIKLYIFD